MRAAPFFAAVMANAGSKLGLGMAVLGLAAVAGVGGWVLATWGSNGRAAWSRSGGAAEAGSAKAGGAGAGAAGAAQGWTSGAGAGTGPLAGLIGKDPVAHYQAGKTRQERLNALSNFMALGDDNNYAMLKAALDDAEADIRMMAVESATALEVGQAVDVWKKSATSADPDVREMTWSLSATYPMESRAAIYREALLRGPSAAVTEALTEMSVTPERPLFEMLLLLGNTLPADRVPQVLQTIQEWLVPGGGEVPQFRSIAEAAAFWERQQGNYDEYLLRTDQ
jgi:hypothetical protein